MKKVVDSARVFLYVNVCGFRAVRKILQNKYYGVHFNRAYIVTSETTEFRANLKWENSLIF